MPKRVYRGKSAYELRTTDGKAIRLCDLNATKETVLEEYKKHTTPIKVVKNLSKLISDFFASDKFSSFAENTQEDYVKYSKKIIKVFGLMRPKDVTIYDLREYFDKRGKQSITQANRERSFLVSLFKWGLQRRYGLDKNPCIGLESFPETPRKRYVTHKEYSEVYNAGSPEVKAAMEIAYRCGCRISDILKMKYSDFMELGIFIEQSKTKTQQIKLWNSKLNQAVNECKLAYEVQSEFVIHRPDGSPFTYTTFRISWDKARKAARLKTGKKLGFTFHDLKKKGVTDFPGSLADKMRFSGHLTEKQVSEYDLSVPLSPTIGELKDD